MLTLTHITLKGKPVKGLDAKELVEKALRLQKIRADIKWG